jgi:hypothetical protein
MSIIPKEFKKKVISPYEKRKKILDINILEKAYRIKKKYLLIAILIFLVFIFSRKYFLFGVVTAASFLFSMYHAKYNRTPMDFKFALFFGLFISRYYGIVFTLFFFIISDIIPSLIGGESIKGSDLFFFGWYFLVNALVYIFPNVPLSILGPVIVIVEAIGSFFINSTFGIPAIMSFFVSILTIIVRIIYFLIFSGILEVVFKAIG